MDYPAPRVGLVDGAPDLADAYGVGVGRWDRFAVDWLYGARTDAEAAPRMAAALAEGLRYRRRRRGAPGRLRAAASAASGTTPPIRSPSSSG